MIRANENTNNMINSVVRTFRGRVELYGSTLADTFYGSGKLKSFTVDRTGEGGKFFGFGICQKLSVQLLDNNRELEITKAHSLRAALGVQQGIATDYTETFPTFYVTEVNRDENNNDLSIVAYDALYGAQERKLAELVNLPAAYTYDTLALMIANELNLGLTYATTDVEDRFCFNSIEGNFDGSESFRRVLDAIAEATQTIYYIDKGNNLTFKELDKNGAAVLSIDKSKYFELDSKPARTLVSIVAATELGDNIGSIAEEGETQYVRDNPFWDMLTDTDRAAAVQSAIAIAGGLSITPFNCSWRGNHLLEIGDKIALTAKDDSIITSYVLNDTIKYSGALSSTISWDHEESNTETSSNPSSLGEALSYTFAKVDKINREVTIAARRAEANEQSLAQLILDTDSINASVVRETEAREAAIEELNGAVNEVSTQVANITLESDKALLEFQNKIATEGVTKIDTKTGFVFDASGLTVETNTSDIKTLISDDGMTISNKSASEELLVVNSTGVDAENLRATTYLMIGNNSRLENYQYNRTGCFWIGN